MAVTVEDLGKFLGSPPPRYVPGPIRRRALKGKIGTAIFGLAFGVFGIPFLYIFFPWNLADDLRLSSAVHAEVRGKVTGSEETRMKENESRVYRLSFSFAAGDGRSQQGTCYRTGSAPDRGREVTVEYLPDKPSVCRIEGCRLSPFGWGAGFVVVFPLIGFGMMFVTWRIRRRTILLLSNGLFSSGRIISVEATNVRVNNQTRYRVNVSYDDSSHADHTASYYAYGHDVSIAHEKCRNEDTVGILYDPTDPKRVLLVDTLVTN